MDSKESKKRTLDAQVSRTWQAPEITHLNLESTQGVRAGRGGRPGRPKNGQPGEGRGRRGS